MKKIYYVRHGETRAGAKGLLAGSSLDTPLNATGMRQSHQTSAHLRGWPVDAIVASPLNRTLAMARIIAADIGHKSPIIQEPLLKERDFGSASGQPLNRALAMPVLAACSEPRWKALDQKIF